MCTLSIIPNNDQTIITMNRDEQRDRPELGYLSTDSGRYFPVDEKSQGTWVGVNQYGLTCALLNRYQDKHLEQAAQSRGDLIPQILHSKNIKEAEKILNDMAFNNFNPFDLITTKNNKMTHAQWNGQTRYITTHSLNTPFFITSSSERVNDVIKHREDIFEEFTSSNTEEKITADFILNNLHLKQGKENNRSSILMQREHTHTKSITQIITTNNTADVFYWTEDKVPLSISTKMAVQEHFPLNNA